MDNPKKPIYIDTSKNSEEVRESYPNGIVIYVPTKPNEPPSPSMCLWVVP